MQREHIDLFFIPGDSYSIDDEIRNKSPKEYYKYYEYRVTDLAVTKVVQASYGIDCSTPSFLGTNEDKVTKIFEYLESFRYTENQSNPNKLKESGGNCQAFSLMFKNLCDNSGIECSIKTTDSHMYNLVVLEGKTYKIDVPNKIFEEVK